MDLNTDFNYEALKLKDDYEGNVTACLISAKANHGNRAAVLYIHGFVDYFFQAHVGEQFIQQEIDFYALDFRKYGRALLPHQHPNYCRDLREYYEEISLSIDIICQQSSKPVYLLGHSTGGLISSLYMHEGARRQSIKGLMLNSPFFAWNLPTAHRIALPLLSKLLGTLWPYSNTPGVLPPVYPQSIHQDFYGEWNFNLEWKPLTGFPAYYCWLSAIDQAHKKLEREVNLNIPVLLMHSSRSTLLKKYGPEAKITDIVLNVEDMKQIGADLGGQTSLQEIPDAMHDIFLSTRAVRQFAFAKMFAWIKALETQ